MDLKGVEMKASADSSPTTREVRATFLSSDQMQDAVSKLSMSGFDRADLSLPSPGLIEGTETSEAGTKPASTETDAQQGRVLGASTAGAVAAMAAAGITIASGGAAAPAIAAAVMAGGAAGGTLFAAHRTADVVEQADRDDRANSGDLVLAVRTATEAKRLDAETILRAAGAINIEVI
jgi:hypothetical protein